MTNSIRKMLGSKVAVRAHAVQILYDSIHVEPGFNLREPSPALEKSIEALADHIAAGGKYPPLEVRIRDEGGVWIVDGHRRHAAIGRVLARGVDLRHPQDGEVRIHVVIFEGNDADRAARIITSAAGEPLTPLEVAEGYKRLRAFGWTPAQIAAKVGKSPEHVLALLLLALRVSGLSASPTADTYKLYAYFDNIAGLTVRAKVTMAGVTIGKVTAIDLDRDSFTGRVTMQLDKKVDNLPTDSTASILTAGLLGEKYIGVSVGGETALLKDGSTIHDTQSSLVLEDLIGKFLLNTVNKDAK